MKTKQFRPHGDKKLYVMQWRRRIGTHAYSPNYDRMDWYPNKWKLNQRYIGKVFTTLHYRACLAPLPIRKRWEKVYINFMKKHFGEIANSKATKHTQQKFFLRNVSPPPGYLQKYTCFKWTNG